MKTTKYFESLRLRSDRSWIKDEWIQSVIDSPEATVIQVDGGIRMWGKIDEAEGRYLRLVFLEDGETLHNMFFDRRFTI